MEAAVERTYALRRDDGIWIEEENVSLDASPVGECSVDPGGEAEVAARIDVAGPVAVGDGSYLGIRAVVHHYHRELAAQSVQAGIEQLRGSECHHDDLDAGVGIRGRPARVLITGARQVRGQHGPTGQRVVVSKLGRSASAPTAKGPVRQEAMAGAGVRESPPRVKGVTACSDRRGRSRPTCASPG